MSGAQPPPRRPGSPASARVLRRALEHPNAPFVVVALSLVLALPALTIGFFCDDYAMLDFLDHRVAFPTAFWDLYRFTPGGARAIEQLVATGSLPWWTAPELELHLIRPLPSLLLSLDHAVFGHAALGWHVHSLAWYFVLLAAAGAFFRCVLSPATATIALLVFALSDATVFPFAWPSARHGLLAASFSALGVLAYVRFRRGRRMAGWLAGLALVAAVLSSEAGLGGFAFAAAYDLVGPSSDTDRARDRIRRALPVVVLGLVYLATYVLLGAGARGSGDYVSPLSNPAAFVRLAAIRIPILWGDAVLGIPADLANIGLSRRLAIAGAVAGALFVVLWRACWPFVPQAERAQLRWLALGALVSVAGAVGGFPGARELIVANLGFAAILAAVVRHGLQSGRFAIARRLGAIVIAIIHMGLAPLGQIANELAMGKIARATVETAHDVAHKTLGTRRVFLVAASDPMVGVYAQAVLASESQALGCLEWLSAARADMILVRTGRASFTLEPRGTTFLRAAFETLYRAPWIPFHEGDEIPVCGAQVRVARLTDGRPSRIEVTSSADLDAPDTAWLAWEAGAMQHVVFPAIGETATIAWSVGPSGMF